MSAILIPLGIALHYGDAFLAFAGFAVIFGVAFFLHGSCGTILYVWRTFTGLPEDVADRLIALGEDPDKFQEIMCSDGANSVRGFTEQLERAASLSRTWSPELRRFAEACRSKHPCPQLSSLSARDRAMIQIYETKIKNAARPLGRKNEIIICCIPAIGIPIAERLWPGMDERSVFLTPEERSEWNTMYTHPDDAFWWFEDYWWNVDDHPQPDNMWFAEIADSIPAGSDRWLVTSGRTWGMMAGGEVVELWSWNGTQAKSLGVVGGCDF